MDTKNEHKILIVDDNSKNIQVAANILNEYNISYASDGETALSIAGSVKPDLILLDVMMPGIDGFEVCKRLKRDQKTFEIPVIFLTSLAESDNIVNGFKTGAADYITKPFKAPELKTRVKTQIDLKKHQDHLEFMVLERTEKLRMTLEQAIGALSAALEKRDPYTAGHQHRVAYIAGMIAEEMKFPDEKIKALKMAALVHDIGKICVPSELLANPRKLTSIEMELIKTHSYEGFEILDKVEFPWPIAQIVLQHHECINGSGYPNGLDKNDILEEAKIIAVSDVVEAMSSHRPYRAALGIGKALEQITRYRGVLYDQDVVDVCELLIKNNRLNL